MLGKKSVAQNGTPTVVNHLVNQVPLTPIQHHWFSVDFKIKSQSISNLTHPSSCMAFKRSWVRFPPAPPMIIKA